MPLAQFVHSQSVNVQLRLPPQMDFLVHGHKTGKEQKIVNKQTPRHPEARATGLSEQTIRRKIKRTPD